MPSSTTPSGDDNASPNPATPVAPDANKDNNVTSATTTPAGAKTTPGQTPRSAPATSRPRSNSRRPEPTLLTDFLLGRPSPARLAAERKRRESIEAVKAELRHEMRQSQVRKVQAPGGVRDRVKAWQKANAAAVASSGAEEAASEPTELAFEEEDSVTEEDRIRIKMRQKKRVATRMKPAVHQSETNLSGTSEHTKPPRRRIVSDDNWVKPKVRKTSIRKVSPRPRKASNQARIPNGYVFRATPNPSASSKVRAWAETVEVPDRHPTRHRRSSKMTDKGSVLEDEETELFSEDEDAASQVTTKQPLKPKLDDNDGIRVRPIRKKKTDDDGIRVSALKSSPAKGQGDGIRVRPPSQAGSEPRTPRPASPLARQRSKTTSASPGKHTILDLIRAVEEATQLSMNEEDSDELDSFLDESTQDPTPKSRPSVKKNKKKQTMHPSARSKSIDTASQWDDEPSHLSGAHVPESELGSSLTAKSLADIPGDIPFGHSAFSELDLPLRGPPKSKPKAKAERTTSLKGMPNVLKKVVEEGKKLIQDMNEPPRHAVPNNPPSIEKWLNNTVEPFAESSRSDSPSPEPNRDSRVQKQPSKETTPRRKPSQETKSSVLSASNITSSVDTDPTEVIPESTTESPKSTPKAKEPAKKAKTPPSTGLKRSRATRSTSTASKSGGRKPFLGVLKEAFQGESSGHSKPIKSYQSQEERRFDSDEEMDSQYMQSNSDLSSWVTTETRSSVDRDSSVRMSKSTPQVAGPRLRPPTSGNHELSTILSEGSSAVESDLTSDVTQSTLTQSTAFTKSSESSKPPQRQGSGLKRRLTRHSDLVSVLSLPDDTNVPQGLKNNRSRPSLRKTRGASGQVTPEELMKEFADDENLYQRELKTLVDGVVPVLLSHVVNDTTAPELFGPGPSRERVEAVTKSVVHMGLALEKLKGAHNKAPLKDMHRMSQWAHGVIPIYQSYIRAWRLGFQDLIVNLAPRGEGIDDEDSLLNALPRNENGDIVNDQGERVAVAYLLKRPLIRVKQMTKLIQCVDSIINSNDTHDLLKDFLTLQERARRRHKEEVARITDEEAINTDTTRARDLRTLAAARSVTIDPGRQVSAKDVFSLDLAHSNGQRLECQVELVHRDNQARPEDQGDLLIREVGDGRRSYLLFPPIAMSLVSACEGDGDFDIIVTVRGNHNGRPWYESLRLSADDEEQILDWLDILPESSAEESDPRVFGESDIEPASPSRLPDVPVGVQSMVGTSSRSQTPEPESEDRPATPPSPTRAPPPPPAPRREKTPAAEEYKSKDQEETSRPLREDMRPDPATLKRTSGAPLYRDDGAPRPPIHRTLSPSPQQMAKSSSQQFLKPPAEIVGGGLKRRTSSPLKHEYLPSDVSSASELSSVVSSMEEEGEEDETEEEDDEDVSDVESSDGEIESLDIPQTELGFSIKKEASQRDSLIPASECSLTPSNSASQAGLHRPKTAPEETVVRYLAAISRWSDKGTWSDISPDHCSVVVTDGLIEAYALRNSHPSRRNSGGADDIIDDKPVLALDLTPLVLMRQSTSVDLEIRSSIQPHCKLAPVYGGGNFRFRCLNGADCYNLYMSVHHARLNNQKFIQLENEARFKSFGERPAPVDNDGDSSSRRRGLFGRKNSYRSSVRAPSQSHDGASTTPSTTPSASSFLKKLTLVGNLSFNLARSSIDKGSQSGSGSNSIYTSGSSSGYGSPRSPSVSVENSGRPPTNFGTENIRIRLHLLVSPTKWEDYGNCSLQIRRPPPGWHQALRADHGLEKRVTVTTTPKKDKEKPIMVLDAVLGSGCFSPMGNRGIVCGIWEEVRGGDGAVPANGPTGGNIKKWCFQFSSVAEASWVLRLVHQEVVRA